MAKEKRGEADGRRLLTAVERLVAEPDKLIRVVEEVARGVPHEGDDEAHRDAVAQALVRRYATRSAISGGAAAAPAIVPGIGSVVTLLGGTLADAALMLKFEVEMALCLTSLFGYDIRDDRERQIAYLLASVSTYEAKSDRNLVLDLVAAEGTAIWNYTPRQVGKALVSTMTKLALLYLSKSLVRVIPFVGVAVGAGMNRALTARVGRKCHEELKLRVQLDA